MSLNSIQVDARGLNCPQPVLATKKALDSIAAGVVTTIVDNITAKENVIKFSTANGCGVSVEQKGEHFYITIAKSRQDAGDVADNNMEDSMVYLIGQATLGNGNDELGAILMKSFLFTLQQKQPLPKTILLINSGVTLAVEGSPVLDQLRALAGQGVAVLACGTCLDFFQLKDRLAVGSVTNMYTIIEEISSAAKAITL